MYQLIRSIEKWSKDRGLDQADSAKQYSFIEGFPNHVITTDGKIVVTSYTDSRGYKRKPKLLKQRINKDGYPEVKLTHFGKKRIAKVHRLVAETYIPNPENKETVNHIDGNKLNNKVSNLEWSDRSEQLYHAYDLGLRKTTPVTKSSAKLANGKPVKCFKKETSETLYFLSARDCSKELGYSPRWCDKIISEMNGETRKFSLEYVSLEEVKRNSDKVSFATLVQLVEYWSIDKGLNEVEPSKQMLKTIEEVGEVAGALAKSDLDNAKEEIGDVVVTLIILSQQLDMDLYDCLDIAYDKIKDRKGEMKNGVFVKQEDL